MELRRCSVNVNKTEQPGPLPSAVNKVGDGDGLKVAGAADRGTEWVLSLRVGAVYVHERVIGDADDDIQIVNTQQNRIDEHANEGWIYGLYKTKHTWTGFAGECGGSSRPRRVHEPSAE